MRTSGTNLTSEDAALLRALYERGPARIGVDDDSPFSLEAAERLERAGLLRAVRPEEGTDGGYFAVSGRGISSLPLMRL